MAQMDKPKCDALSWNIEMTSTKVVAALSFTDFEQSQRFVVLLTKFIQAERRPPQILDEVAWYCPPEQANAGSVR
ncbi:hypothetical protein [Bradyrhizobium elkanii]|uniref:hypothetical protein n=1 Tax=Bradyrhizobium elkanii TaxID=29448 RepID=UPI00272D7857|nr:hypothetical protein [Bradyrhizobium elkanii]WLA80256.1 hypothetical protein QNJ99_33450 [Bradyrhizobium elkanii]